MSPTAASQLMMVLDYASRTSRWRASRRTWARGVLGLGAALVAPNALALIATADGVVTQAAEALGHGYATANLPALPPVAAWTPGPDHQK